MMCLGIVAALFSEARMLARDAVVRNISGGLAEGTPLLASSGIGARHARQAGERLLARGAQALLSWGVAAGLDPGIASGSLVLPRAIVTADWNVLEVDHNWHARLHASLAPHLSVYTEPIVESPAVLAHPHAKRRLHAQSGAVAADMESAALGALAREAGVPFLVVRAVSDCADHAVPTVALAALDAQGRIRSAALLGMLREPRSWPALARLAWGFHQAQTTLKTVARHAGIDLFPIVRSAATVEDRDGKRWSPL